jgi:hypothetical protein
MKTLDLSETVKNLEGQELKDENGNALTFGHLLGQTLVTSNGEAGDPIKMFDWGHALYKTGKVEIDFSDLTTLETFVKNVKTLTILAKGPILKKISLAKG